VVFPQIAVPAFQPSGLAIRRYLGHPWSSAHRGQGLWGGPYSPSGWPGLPARGNAEGPGHLGFPASRHTHGAMLGPAGHTRFCVAWPVKNSRTHAMKECSDA